MQTQDEDACAQKHTKDTTNNSADVSKDILTIEQKVDKILQEKANKFPSSSTVQNDCGNTPKDEKHDTTPLNANQFSAQHKLKHAMYFIRIKVKKKKGAIEQTDTRVSKHRGGVARYKKKKEKHSKMSKKVSTIEKKLPKIKIKKRIGIRKHKTFTIAQTGKPSQDTSPTSSQGESDKIPRGDEETIKKLREKSSHPKPSPSPEVDKIVGQISTDEAAFLDSRIQGITTERTMDGSASSDDTEHTVASKSGKRKKKTSEMRKEISDKEHIFTIDDSITSGAQSAPDGKHDKEWYEVITAKKKKKDGMDQSPAEGQAGGVPQVTVPSSSETTSHVIADRQQSELSKDLLQIKYATLKNFGFVGEKWEELDFYPLYEPFAYVEIIRDKESLDKRYVLIEGDLSDDEAHVYTFLLETLHGYNIDADEVETKGEKKYLREKIEQIIVGYDVKLNAVSKGKLLYHLEKQFLGLGHIEALMKDPNIEDISCDGAHVPIFLYHRKYGSLKSNVEYTDEEELSAFVVKLATKCGKHISIAEPMLDATMPDGSRIQMTLSTEITTKGSTFTIRKFREDPFSPPDLIEFNTMSSEMVAYMWLAVEKGVNALIAGGTASGKTSTLNALSLFIPRDSKIVSIEETREINLPHPNWIPGVARSGFGEVVNDKMLGEIDMFDLMKAALRQRPEYIIVGEIRGKEAYVLFQAMATGHTTYSTAHADSAQSLIHRLEGKPISIPRIMLQALDIICIQITARVKDKRVRRCKQIIEIIDIDPVTKEILTNEVFRWDPIEDRFIYSGKSYVLERIRTEQGVGREEFTIEIKNRARLLEWMNRTNIREFRQVAKLLAQYAENPGDVVKRIEGATKS